MGVRSEPCDECRGRSGEPATENQGVYFTADKTAELRSEGWVGTSGGTGPFDWRGKHVDCCLRSRSYRKPMWRKQEREGR